MLIFDIRCDGAHTNAHRPDEDESIELLPLTTHIYTLNGFGTKFTLERLGDCTTSLADLNDCYIHL